MKKFKLYTSIAAVALWTATSIYAVEVTRTEETDPSIPSGSILQDGIVEEVSASDLEFYGLSQDERYPIEASVRVRSYYDSNVFLRNNNKIDDFMWEVQPSIAYENTRNPGDAANYFTIGYDPTFIFFSTLSGQDSINHSGFAKYVYTSDKGNVTFSHRSAQADGANADIGQRVNRLTHTSIISGEYQATGKILLQASGKQSLGYYETLRDLHQWSVDGFALYEVLPKVKLGLGTEIGWVDIAGSPNQTYQQGLVKLVYDPSSKLQVVAKGGADFRQYQNPLGADDRVTPAMSLGFNWTPFDSTTVSVNGYRNISASNSVAASNYVATGFRASVKQRLIQKIHYTLGGGYENSDYRSTLRGGTNNRDDDYYFITNSLDYDFYKHGSVKLFHKYEDNSSSASPFDRQELGIEVTLKY